MPLQKIVAWYRRYERPISSISLFGGFAFDAVTLRRADAFWENFWIIIHLLVCATAILILNRRGKPGLDRERIDFWLVNILQFTFGGLLSAFLIFYFKGAVLATSWPFLLLLLGAFIANERMRLFKQHIFQLSFFFFCIFIFLIYVWPVILRTMGYSIFLLAGLSAFLIHLGFLKLIDKFGHNDLEHLPQLRIIIFSILGVMTLLYFVNVIPPLPLSLVEAGIYHNVEKSGNDYILTKESESWYQSLLETNFHIGSGNTAYLFSAIFSPANFHISVTDVWQEWDEESRKWIDITRVDLPIGGGRSEGYRTFSFATVYPGEWRVSVLTPQGLVIGRVAFKVLAGNPTNLVVEKH